MAHTKSAEKRMRQDEKRRLRNRQTKKAIKVQIKSFLGVAKTGTADELQAEYNLAVKKLDKAAEAVHVILTEGRAAAMNRFNRKAGED